MSETPDPLTTRTMLLPFLRHRTTCALQGDRDNPPWDELCTCDLSERWLALETSTAAARPSPAEPPAGDTVGAAWKAVEDALPAGWNDVLLMKTDRHGLPGYAATATEPRDESGAYRILSTTADGRKPDPTPAAALTELARMLATVRSTTPPEPEDGGT